MKKILFVQGGSRVKEDEKGELYTDGNFSESIWNRYLNYSNDLSVILRKETKIFSCIYAQAKFNYFDSHKIKYIPVVDLFKPTKNFFSFRKRLSIKKTIKMSVLNSEYVIIRSPSSYYSYATYKYCKKYNKPFLVEVTGFAFEGQRYHGFFGKILSIYCEYKQKKVLKESQYSVYVTKKALQKRYPTKGKNIGCSDVEILKDYDFYERNFSKKYITLGTAAFLDVKRKGQINVLKALNSLKSKGITRFRYELVGIGDGKRLKDYVNKHKLNDVVTFCGAIPHSKIFDWYKSIDIYIQPSFQEGLCRSIVEAMSQTCPVICTNVGGNSELINKEFIYNKNNWRKLSLILENIDINALKEESHSNFIKSKTFSFSALNKNRDNFYFDFLSDEK